MNVKPIFLAGMLLAPHAGAAQRAPAAADLHAPVSSVAQGAAQPVVTAEAPAAPASAERKHGIFPLWGDKVRAKGFDLPNPYTVMVNYYYQESKLQIDNLRLGFNGGPMQDFSDVIQVPSATAKASALAVRPSIMILPFFSVYGVFSSGSTKTDVNVASPVLPIDFTTEVKSGAQVLTLGGTFQLAYRGLFVVADFNAAVSDVDRLADLVGANMLSFRLGKAFKLNEQGRRIVVWAGTAGQVIDVDTSGEVRLQSVLPPTSADCTNVRPALQARCQELVAAITDPNATVQYSLDKKPLHVWNGVVGAQYALDRSWAFRTEVSFLNGRTSVLAGTEYAFDIY